MLFMGLYSRKLIYLNHGFLGPMISRDGPRKCNYTVTIIEIAEVP